MSNAVWYFTTEGEKIVLQARFEQGGIIRDAVQVINPGETLRSRSSRSSRSSAAGARPIKGQARVQNREVSCGVKPGSHQCAGLLYLSNRN